MFAHFLGFKNFVTGDQQLVPPFKGPLLQVQVHTKQKAEKVPKPPS